MASCKQFDLWNLPQKTLPDRFDLFSDIIDAYGCGQFTTRNRCEFLEIGVWHAGTLSRLIEKLGPIFNYVGVDPYGTQDDDYYRGPFGFWSTNKEADAVYDKARRIFESSGALLHRETSKSYFEKNKTKFDVIFVDGDHRYNGCLYDCEQALHHIKPGGLLIVDDYGNNFHPEVEWALREFYKRHSSRFSQMGCHPLFFQLDGMFAPVMLSFICFQIN